MSTNGCSRAQLCTLLPLCTRLQQVKAALGSCSRFAAEEEQIKISLDLCLRYENLEDPINGTGSCLQG